MGFSVDACRAQFPALAREQDGRAVVFLDGPAGSQVPTRVAEAVARYLTTSNANAGGPFATSRESDAALRTATEAVASFVGTDDPDEVAFGPNMTTLTLGLSRALARTWSRGDEVVVTRLDHDANVTPWALAARDAGATLRKVDIRVEDATLDVDALRAALSERTRLVAVTAASNVVGSRTSLPEIADAVHGVGAELFVDAVHAAPHFLPDVRGWGCDYLAFSAYKLYGPHVGVLWGRRALLESAPAYKVRPAPDSIPGRWMTGTQCHEGIVGTGEAIAYLSELGEGPTRRARLESAYHRIAAHERELASRLLSGLAELDAYRVWGIPDPQRLAERAPTVSVTHRAHRPTELASRLAERGIYAWPGHHYAVELCDALGIPEGTLRLGILHYNTPAEIDRALGALAEMG